jgi:hypothetical protein
MCRLIVFLLTKCASSVDRFKTSSRAGLTSTTRPRSSADVDQSLADPVSQHSDSPSPREKDALMVRSASLRSVALQQSLTVRSPARLPESNAVSVASPASVDAARDITEHGTVSVAINTSVLREAGSGYLRHESAAQTSPHQLSKFSVSEASVDNYVPEHSSDHVRAGRHGSEQTVDKSLMTEQTGQLNVPNAPPAWNHILDSLSARLGAMRSRVVIAEQRLNAGKEQ